MSMGVYIKGRDMPDTCGSCPCFHAETPMYCQAVKAAVQKPRIVHPYAKGRPEWCPLIEIPPHGDLIDRSKLDYAFTALQFDEEGLAHYGDRHDWLLEGVDIEKLIYNAPTIIPASQEGGGR